MGLHPVPLQDSQRHEDHPSLHHHPWLYYRPSSRFASSSSLHLFISPPPSSLLPPPSSLLPPPSSLLPPPSSLLPPPSSLLPPPSSLLFSSSSLLPPLLFIDDFYSGVLLYSRFLLSTREREKVKYVGSKYAQNNIDAGQDWWFINGTGVNGGMPLSPLLLTLPSPFSCFFFSSLVHGMVA